jgi:hypothetical protein
VECDGAYGMNEQGSEDHGWRRISNSAVALRNLRRAMCKQAQSCYPPKPGRDGGRVLRATGAETEGLQRKGHCPWRDRPSIGRRETWEVVEIRSQNRRFKRWAWQMRLANEPSRNGDYSGKETAPGDTALFVFGPEGKETGSAPIELSGARAMREGRLVRVGNEKQRGAGDMAYATARQALL